MTEGQRVKLEGLIEDYELAVTVRESQEPSMSITSAWQLADNSVIQCHEKIQDQLDVIQRFNEAQTLLIKVYADELNSDSEDLLYHFHRSLEKQDLLDSTTQTQIEPVKRNGAR